MEINRLSPTFVSEIMSRNYMSKNDELRKGDYLLSNNEKYKAIFQVIIDIYIYIYVMYTSFTTLSGSKR